MVGRAIGEFHERLVGIVSYSHPEAISTMTMVRTAGKMRDGAPQLILGAIDRIGQAASCPQDRKRDLYFLVALFLHALILQVIHVCIQHERLRSDRKFLESRAFRRNILPDHALQHALFIVGHLESLMVHLAEYRRPVDDIFHQPFLRHHDFYGIGRNHAEEKRVLQPQIGVGDFQQRKHVV